MSDSNDVSLRARKPRDDRRRKHNREKLVDAALAMVASEGGGALTVARVTRAVNMDASGFYAHFKNIGECEQAAADTFAEYMRGHLAPYRKLKASAAPADASSATAALLRSWLQRRDWIVLIARCQHEQSAMGEATRALLQTVREDVAEGLWQRAGELGLRGHTIRELNLVADLCVGLFVTVLNRLADGREQDVDAMAAALVRANATLIRTEFARLGELRAQKTKH